MGLQPLDKMKAPGDVRLGAWRGGVIQVKVTNACDLDCVHCSVGVGFARRLHRVFRMSPRHFRRALRSLSGYPGVIGMFGGNPCIHPDFEELCAIFRREIPNIEQRGLWSNNLNGYGAVCRETFYSPHSNLNVHGSQKAWDEIKVSWPEAQPILAGLHSPSMHGPIFGSPLNVGYTVPEMWDMVGRCHVNQHWSAAITMVNGCLEGFFCEIAATMSELRNISVGMSIAPGWWRKPMEDFIHQVNASCTVCLVPLNALKTDAAGKGCDIISNVWQTTLTVKGRPVQVITSLVRGDSPATKYLPTGTAAANTPQG